MLPETLVESWECLRFCPCPLETGASTGLAEGRPITRILSWQSLGSSVLGVLDFRWILLVNKMDCGVLEEVFSFFSDISIWNAHGDQQRAKQNPKRGGQNQAGAPLSPWSISGNLWNVHTGVWQVTSLETQRHEEKSKTLLSPTHEWQLEKGLTVAVPHRMSYWGPNLIGRFANYHRSATPKRESLVRTPMSQMLGQPTVTLAKKHGVEISMFWNTE